MKLSPPIIHREYQQNSLEWLHAHAGVLTASQFGQFFDSDWEVRTGEMPKKLLARKLAEWWMGGPLIANEVNTFSIEQGRILEQEALPWLTLEKDIAVERVGFVTTDDGLIGCSPDGLIGDNSGIEVKCPNADTHVRYLIDGGLPREYVAQVHGCLYVTQRPSWLFLSYRRGFTPLLLTISRNQEIMDKIHLGLQAWHQWFAVCKDRLEKINGEPRPARMDWSKKIEDPAWVEEATT